MPLFFTYVPLLPETRYFLSSQSSLQENKAKSEVTVTQEGSFLILTVSPLLLAQIFQAAPWSPCKNTS